MKGLAQMASKQKLRNVRASLGLTQKQLAEKAHVSEPAIIDMEKNRTQPRLITAYAILNALNEVLREKGREEVTLDSFDWRVQHDE